VIGGVDAGPPGEVSSRGILGLSGAIDMLSGELAPPHLLTASSY
jgi:hypothetical protein